MSSNSAFDKLTCRGMATPTTELITDYLQQFNHVSQVLALATHHGSNSYATMLKTKFGETKPVSLLVSLHEKAEQLEDYACYVILIKSNSNSSSNQQLLVPSNNNKSMLATEFDDAIKDDKTRAEFAQFCKKGLL